MNLQIVEYLLDFSPLREVLVESEEVFELELGLADGVILARRQP